MIIITGIGRSGTSFTAKVLCEAGTNFKGDWFDENIKAGMEYLKVANLNNLLIQGAASSLDEAITKLNIPEVKSELPDGVIVKDPRFTMTLDHWLSAGFNVEHIIYCAREHREIYDSSIKSDCGLGGDLVNGIRIPSFSGFQIFSTYLERMFFNLAASSGIPVTTIFFPKSVEDFSEIEKLAFLADKERLKEAWEKLRRPDMVGSRAVQIPELNDKQMLIEAYAKLSQKEQKIIELSSYVATLEKRAKAAEASWPKKMERTFRKKLVYPIKNQFSSYYLDKFSPKILGNSIPKSGTHLLNEIFFNMGYKKSLMEVGFRTPELVNKLTSEEIERKIKSLKGGEYFYGHHDFDEKFNETLKKNKISHILIVRDPRDVVVSLAFYIPKSSEHVLCSYFNSLNKRDRFVTSIKGVPGSLESMAEKYDKYLPWLYEDSCLVVKFEDLIGSRGGGSDEKQLETLKQIAKHSGTSFNESKLQEVSHKSFNENSPTFRKGQIGDWVNWLDDEMLEILRKDKDIFEKFGYTL